MPGRGPTLSIAGALLFHIVVAMVAILLDPIWRAGGSLTAVKNSLLWSQTACWKTRVALIYFWGMVSGRKVRVAKLMSLCRDRCARVPERS
jgi:hypothetical protein